MENELIFISLCAIFVFLLIVSLGFNFQPGHYIFKPLASSCFIALAIFSDAFSTLFGKFILLALVFSFFGDVFLIPKSKVLFLGGVASFAAAHVCYIIAFLLRGYVSLYPILYAVYFLVQGHNISYYLINKLIIISILVFVSAFIFVVDVLVYAKFLLPYVKSDIMKSCYLKTKDIYLIIAAVLFQLSDMCVGLSEFVFASTPYDQSNKDKESTAKYVKYQKSLRLKRFLCRLVGLPLYFTAQILFASSCFTIYHTKRYYSD